MDRIKAAFFSLTELDDPAGYIEWHQMDHMPEQFRIRGLAWGQRFVSTQSCLDASAARHGPIGRARHLQTYLLDEPVNALQEIGTLGRELAGQGRHRDGITAHVQTAFQLLRTYAAPRVLVSAEVIPFRPNNGVYLLVEQVQDTSGLSSWVRRQHEAMPELLEVPGIAGIWNYAVAGDDRSATPYGLRPSDVQITVMYLDDDPIGVAARVLPALDRRWHDAPVTPVLAGPFRSLFPPPRAWIPSDEGEPP